MKVLLIGAQYVIITSVTTHIKSVALLHPHPHLGRYVCILILYLGSHFDHFHTYLASPLELKLQQCTHS